VSRIGGLIEEIQYHLKQLSIPITKTEVTNTTVSETSTTAEPGDKKEHEIGRPSSSEKCLLSVVKPKLPKLHIVKFSDEVIKFKTFWDSFNSTFHKKIHHCLKLTNLAIYEGCLKVLWPLLSKGLCYLRKYIMQLVNSYIRRKTFFWILICNNHTYKLPNHTNNKAT